MQLDRKHHHAVAAILARRVAGFEVRAFGSRVEGDAHPASDLDLVVMTREPLPAVVLGRLRGDFAESELPMRVDVSDWSRLPDYIRVAIENRSEVIQAGDA